ncbi:MAG: hypothetical protein WDM78_01710 [Puia sp.]
MIRTDLGTTILSELPTSVIFPFRTNTVPFSMGAAAGDGYIRAPTSATSPGMLDVWQKTEHANK